MLLRRIGSAASSARPLIKEASLVGPDKRMFALLYDLDLVRAELKPLPRYSPDLNPIELLWSKLKHFIKKARADTAEALEQAVETAVALVCGADARGWFEHCGFCLQLD